jgi:aerobic carbon-monoxide dehydrogenase large subunit
MDAHDHHAFEPRVEDNQLVRGGGRFVEDAAHPGQAFAAFVRSPHAFAKIVSVDADAARTAPGVLAVLTAKDMEGVGSIARHPPMVGRGGAKLAMPFRPSLAGERVMHLGEPVAMVIAQSAAAAQDATELVSVEYEELPPVIDVRDAVRPGAPQLYPDVPGNIAIDWPGPAADAEANAREVEQIIAATHKVARVTHRNQRMVVNSMEPRGGTGSYDAATDSYTLRVCSQGAGPLADQIASIMRLPKEKLRVVTEDVGGAFGLKTAVYPEYPALLVAARKLGRPVHWMSTRSEAFLTDNHGRDAVTEAELALDEKGKFLALRVRHLANMGAYITPAGAHLATNNFARCFPTMYRIANIDASTRCVFTNTVPTGPYRGAGRPEANYILERVVDEAARLTGVDRVRLRRRNLIPRSSMPYKTAVGTTYDSGEFPAIFEKALELSGYAGFNKRKREAKSRGKYRGIGISCFLEHSGGMPTEGAALIFPGGETLVLGLGVQSTGQAHATVFPRLVAQKLGIPPEQIQHRHGDTALGIPGMPSVASRSAMTAGTAIVKAVDAMLVKGKSLAAGMLETADADVAYRDGNFEVVGTDRRISLFEVANRAAAAAKRGGNAETLDTKLSVDTPQTFPNGVHIAEVEVDPATGNVHVVSYTAVDDCGNVLDHTIVAGQVQGALAQGLGQALKEVATYDASGQLVTGSFMDYAMPRAEDMPAIRDALHPVPATTNPLGVKGVGEAGTTASIAAVMNAIADAIPGEAGAKLDMPATPEKVWKACREGATYRLV